MTNPTLKASLDRDWASIGLYAIIWGLWIVALVRDTRLAAIMALLLVLFANPFIERRVSGVEIRTNTEIAGRRLHSAFRTKDGKTVLRVPNRALRRVTLAVIAIVIGIQAFAVLNDFDLQQHPVIIISGIMAFAAFFLFGFVFACIRGMRPGHVLTGDGTSA